MIDIKTPKEISIMAAGGKILAEVLSEVLSKIKPGVSELELDNLAEKLIRGKGAEPGFKRVEGYRYSICISTNEAVVHGIPTDYRFKEGDVVGVDCGVYFKGFNTDMAQTIEVKGQSDDSVDKFLKTGEKALIEGIKQAMPGNRVGHISKAIQDIVEEKGYSVVRSLVGHGVGRELHEEPEVPGFLIKKIDQTPNLKEGMVIAVEVIYNMGKADVEYSNDDGWTIKTKDNSLSGLFERTIAVTKSGPVVLTTV
ncbi:MAG: hypothetical protein ACD_50C00093G0009 [uncultured bacterium]|nr:MAG: hypothetical protein ACD_50C00093G0009 [uncultured bacterium]OGH13769.1 MAG: type I methionyl aminopeptidase [Candidatus Levybacteria bacterium RIFCSPHIGHO2_01_FULL_38_26]